MAMNEPPIPLNSECDCHRWVVNAGFSQTSQYHKHAQPTTDHKARQGLSHRTDATFVTPTQNQPKQHKAEDKLRQPGFESKVIDRPFNGVEPKPHGGSQQLS